MFIEKSINFGDYFKSGKKNIKNPNSHIILKFEVKYDDNFNLVEPFSILILDLGGIEGLKFDNIEGNGNDNTLLNLKNFITILNDNENSKVKELKKILPIDNSKLTKIIGEYIERGNEIDII